MDIREKQESDEQERDEDIHNNRRSKNNFRQTNWWKEQDHQDLLSPFECGEAETKRTNCSLSYQHSSKSIFPMWSVGYHYVKIWVNLFISYQINSYMMLIL